MSDHTILIDAIRSRFQVTFRYKPTDAEESTVRIVEPWIYGTKNGKESLYGYQISGGEVGPRRFDLRKVKHITLTGFNCEEHPDSMDMTKWDEVLAEWSPHDAEAA